MESLKNRNLVAEATERGSSATTRRGAIRFLIAHRHREQSILASLDIRVSRVLAGGTTVPARWTGTGPGTGAWKRAVDARRSSPDAKRARDDARFRRGYLAGLSREFNRLIATPGADVDAAYERLVTIQRLRSIVYGRDPQPVPERAWRTTREMREIAHALALLAGLEDDGLGSSRGDHFETVPIDWAPASQYHGAGDLIVLARETRKRVYAKSSKWYPSLRSDVYVVGENENGNPYRHQVPSHITSLSDAMEWIWSGAEIVARQGDIGIAPSRLQHVVGEECDVPVGGGHSRHRFIGQCYQNGSLHVRSGFLIHTAGQHPPIYLDGSCWRRIVIARRSERGMSSHD